MSNAQPKSVRKAGTTDVLVIGAGQSGLAMSYCLNERGIDHVVVERGEVANSWRTERWDSLKLLTPNWMTRLPGFSYSGDNPDGFMSVREVASFMQRYSDSSGAPVRTHTTVKSVRPCDGGYRVETDKGDWQAKSVVIASGAFNVASKPKVAEMVPAGVEQLTPHQYRNTDQLTEGGVLIVGASATGLQLADEIRKAGHEVTIAAGEHVRMPRRYRGRDILDWMDCTGILGECYSDMEDISRARKLPSSQLVGSHDYELLDLNHLVDKGAKVAGRLMGINNGVAQFSGSLANVCKLADLKMNRLLDAIDEWVEEKSVVCEAQKRFDDTRIDDRPTLTLDLEMSGIRTIIWATGFRPDYSWLDVPVLDRKGHLKHNGGVVEAPGLYVLGLPVMRRRKSSFIYGTEDDVRDLVPHIARYLGTTPAPEVAYQRFTADESLSAAGYARA